MNVCKQCSRNKTRFGFLTCFCSTGSCQGGDSSSVWLCALRNNTDTCWSGDGSFPRSDTPETSSPNKTQSKRLVCIYMLALWSFTQNNSRETDQFDSCEFVKESTDWLKWSERFCVTIYIVYQRLCSTKRHEGASNDRTFPLIMFYYYCFFIYFINVSPSQKNVNG